MSIDPASFGYVFYPFPDGFSIGYAQLVIFVSDAEEAEGFVPSQVIVSTWEDGGRTVGLDEPPGTEESAGTIVRTTIAAHIAAPTEGDITHHVAPGFVTVLSKHGGELNAYCFGGHLAYHLAENTVTCRLTSPAPILNLSEEGLDWSENGILRVVDGLESELATLRARIASDRESSFNQRLAHTDPRLLYAAGLDLAYRSFQSLPEVLRTEHYWDEYSVLARAQQEAKQSSWWPDDPSLPAVLGRRV